MVKRGALLYLFVPTMSTMHTYGTYVTISFYDLLGKISIIINLRLKIDVYDIGEQNVITRTSKLNKKYAL